MTNAIHLSTFRLQKIFLLLLLSFGPFFPVKVFSQGIIEVTSDVSSQPHQFQIFGSMDPGYISNIVIHLADAQGDTTELRMYFKHCSPNNVIQYFDTTVAVQSTLPYDLLILTYRDSNTVAAGPLPCPLINMSIVPVDTFFLRADQILSTGGERRTLEINVYPNPVTDNLRFTGSVHWNEAVVYSLTGVRVMQITASDHQSHIHVGHLAPGMYMLVLRKEDGTIIGRSKFVRSQ